uniref:Retrotransposon protein, putative, unclassified n=1 Tax=Oryza sativa subsp. japonica TaxID=39947 RepID=Q2QPT5_ORYSJ|nr:retrotransposon protein, putative, unclassified [Oryza sativa Japonica Group]
MAEKPPLSPSSASPGSGKEKTQKFGLIDVHEGNVVPIDPEKFTHEQKKYFNAMMQQARDQFLSSFMQTRKGTFFQKYKLKVVPEDFGIGSSKEGEKKQIPDGSAQPSNKGATNGSPGDQGDDPQGDHGVQGDGTQGPQGGNLNQNDNAFQDFFNNFQDRVDYAVYCALINQSGVLTNTLSNMMKSVADGSIAEHQAAGPAYLQGGTFPNYRTLITDVHPLTQGVPPVASSAQPTAPASAPAPAAPSSAPGQLINPQLLVREQSQYPGPNVIQLTQDQVASMFLPPQNAINSAQQQPIQQTPSRQQVVQPIQQASPIQQAVQPVQQTPPKQPALQPIQQTPLRQQPVQYTANQAVPEHLVHHMQPDGSVVAQVIPEHLARGIQPNLHNCQGGNLSYQYQPPSPQVQYQQTGSVPPQFYNQFEPIPQQTPQQRPWADVIADVMREQFGLKPKETGNLYRQPYPEWFERVPLPNRFKVPDFSKFSGQNTTSTYEHISRFLAQCGEASAVDALRVRLFRLSLAGSAFTWFSSLPHGSINSWADLEKQFHSYFYSGVHEMKLSDLTSIKQKHDELVHEYIQRFREMRNKCYSLSLTDAQLADLAFQGLISPIREKFSSEDFESLLHLTQKVALHEQRFTDARKNSRKINHVYPYMYGSDDEDDDSKIAAAEWVRNKKVIPCQWVKGSGKEERYDFDITKADKIFDLLLQEKQIQFPTGHTIPSAEELGKKRYCKWHNSGSHTTNDCKVFRQQIQMAIEGGKIKFDDSKKPMKVDGNPFPINMVHTADRVRAKGFQVNSAKMINKYQRKYDKQQEKHYEEHDDGFDPHWGCEFFRFCWNEGMRLPSIENCPGCNGIIESSSQSYNGNNRLRQERVSVHQRLGLVNQGRGQKDEVVRTNQWCPSVEEAKRLAKGKSVVTAPVNMVFTLPAEFGIDQADVDEIEEESAKLVLSPERAMFEKPEGIENRHLKPLYINGYVNGKPMSKMMVDGGAAVNLMPYATFRELGRNAEDLIKTNMVLKDFGGNPSETKGVLNVELTVDSKTIPTTFFVIDGKGSYSLLLGRDWIHANCCIPSTMHQCLIQWQGDNIEIVPADSQLKMKNPSYYFEGVVEGSNVYTKDTVDDLDDKQGQGFMSADDLEEIDIGPGDRPRPTFISKNLCAEFRTKLIELLKEFRDCFAWEYYEMPGLSQSIVQHRLPIKPGVRLNQQPPRRCKADMLEPVKAEIQRLYDAGFIRPCRYAEWISSIVPIIKKNGKVRVYIDDVVVKSKEIEDHIADLRKVFERTRKYGLKMNPTKCAFGVPAGQFLGFLVHEREIKITQRSISAIKKIKPPKDKTELQEMIGKINFVRRFISNLSGRLEPFTPLLRLKADQQFTWGVERQKALDNIKEYLSSPPVLISPQKGVPFRLYLSAGEKSIGSVLIQELEGKERVVFYLSRRLLDAETRYSSVEKLCLCLYFSCTRLRHYLLSNECTVICKADMVKYMLSAPILKGRVGKWIFSLTEFDLRYGSPKAVKGQAIADFIVDYRDDSIGSVEIVPWTLLFDGLVCAHGCGIGLVIILPREACFEFAYTIKSYATNNQAVTS